MSRKKEITLNKLEMKWVVCLTNDCNEEVKVEGTAKGGYCWRCTQNMAGAPERLLKKKKKEKKIRRPRGWRFYNEFVDAEGNVFFKGVEQPDLKGTKEPTVIELKEKKTRFEREQERVQKQKKLAEKYRKKQEKNGKRKKRRKKKK